jgi:hypothetical protein
LKGNNQWLSSRSTTATPASKTRLPPTLDQTNLARMAAAAQAAAAAEAAAASLDSYIVDGRCRHLRARDSRRRAAARRRLQRHLTRRVLTAAAWEGPKARKHDNPIGRLTVGQNDEKGRRKSWWFFGSSHVLALFWFLDFGHLSMLSIW